MHKSSSLTVTDQFCGAGGTSLGAVQAGAEIKLALNHWKLAVETHNTNFPDTWHDCTDISACDPRRYPSTNILLTSPECFPAGTLILAKRGLIPIEDMRIGDEVLTHRNRWRSVLHKQSRTASTILICGQGHPGLEVTPEHPFYVREQTRKWDNTRRCYNQRLYSEPTWVVSHLLSQRKYRWATPINVPSMDVPPILGRGMPSDDPEFWWLVGRWLGDGTVRLRPDQGGEVTIVAGNHEADELEHRLAHWFPMGTNIRAGDGELRWRRRNVRTATLFECEHRGFVEWLIEHFGRLAYGKTVPVWALTLPSNYRQALLEGYLSADGYISSRRTAASTISKRLAVGMRLLAESLGYRVSLFLYGQHTDTIESRRIKIRLQWIITWENNASQRIAFADEVYSWGLVKRKEAGRNNITVYNLSIEEDESYVADGIVVHNCTNHSIAQGRRRKNQGRLSLWETPKIDPAEDRSRATMLDVPRFAEFHRYELIIVENVVDARHWILFDEWLLMMQKLDYQWEIVYYNSMFAPPTPQSRDRMYVVFWKRGNPVPNLRFTPPAHCQRCDKRIEAIQSWKKSGTPWGRYGRNGQYVYRCPSCAKEVLPFYHAAMNAIDWHFPIQRIGDRKKALKAKTIRRIEIGLRKFQGKFVQNTKIASEWVHPLIEILSPQTDSNEQARVSPFLVSLSHGSDSGRVTEVTSAMQTQTTRQDQALVVPFMMDLLWEYRSRPITDPLTTVVAGGNHHGLILPPPVSSSFLVSYYGKENMRLLSEPMGTITTVDRHALVTGAQSSVQVEDCSFRMLQPSEIGRAMAFPQNYIVLGNVRQRVRQYGNAVTPPVMRMILERCIETLK